MHFGKMILGQLRIREAQATYRALQPAYCAGFMEAWDVIETQHSPIMTVKVQEAPLHCLSAHPEVGLSTLMMKMMAMVIYIQCQCGGFYMSVMENHHFEMCLSVTKK